VWHSLWNDAALLNRIAALLAFAALCALSVVVVRRVAAQPAFAIQRVVVTTPLVRADAGHVAAVIQQAFRGTFFTIDLPAARDALGRVPWLKSVAIRRQWPATLEVAVAEHQPLARWNESALVSTDGIVFDAQYGDELPEFRGTDGAAAEMAQRYREFSATLKPRHASIEALARSARGAWDVRLSDGMTIALGRESVVERWMRWITLSERYGAGLAPSGKLVAVDLRYRNGFAARLAANERAEGAGGARPREAGKSGKAAKAAAKPAKSGATRVR
jgi:cell division protein FtsQ